MFDLSWKNNGFFGCLTVLPLVMIFLALLVGAFALGYCSGDGSLSRLRVWVQHVPEKRDPLCPAL